jgi:enamine deaminase RidA (YjgF/YER057c/UK114 family)
MKKDGSAFKPGAFWTYGSKVKLAEIRELVFLAGVVPIDRKGKLVGKKDFKAQMAQVVGNISEILAGAGGSLDDVMSMRTFIRPEAMKDFKKSGAWRRKTFPGLFGQQKGDQKGVPGTLIGITTLSNKDFLLEMEVVAALK